MKTMKLKAHDMRSYPENPDRDFLVKSTKIRKLNDPN